MYRIFLLYALSGFLSLGYQVAWFRIFNDWFGSTSVTFALVVCGFIGGLGLGALYSQQLTHWLSERFKLADSLKVYGVVEILVGLTVLFTVVLQLMPSQLFGAFPYALDAEGFWVPALTMRLFQFGAAVFCLVLPVFLWERPTHFCATHS